MCVFIIIQLLLQGQFRKTSKEVQETAKGFTSKSLTFLWNHVVYRNYLINTCISLHYGDLPVKQIIVFNLDNIFKNLNSFLFFYVSI